MNLADYLAGIYDPNDPRLRQGARPPMIDLTRVAPPEAYAGPPLPPPPVDTLPATLSQTMMMQDAPPPMPMGMPVDIAQGPQPRVRLENVAPIDDLVYRPGVTPPPVIDDLVYRPGQSPAPVPTPLPFITPGAQGGRPRTFSLPVPEGPPPQPVPPPQDTLVPRRPQPGAQPKQLSMVGGQARPSNTMDLRPKTGMTDVPYDMSYLGEAYGGGDLAGGANFKITVPSTATTSGGGPSTGKNYEILNYEPGASVVQVKHPMGRVFTIDRETVKDPGHRKILEIADNEYPNFAPQEIDTFTHTALDGTNLTGKVEPIEGMPGYVRFEDDDLPIAISDLNEFGDDNFPKGLRNQYHNAIEQPFGNIWQWGGQEKLFQPQGDWWTGLQPATEVPITAADKWGTNRDWWAPQEEFTGGISFKVVETGNSAPQIEVVYANPELVPEPYKELINKRVTEENNALAATSAGMASYANPEVDTDRDATIRQAQKEYDLAVASKDPARIKNRKAELDKVLAGSTTTMAIPGAGGATIGAAVTTTVNPTIQSNLNPYSFEHVQAARHPDSGTANNAVVGGFDQTVDNLGESILFDSGTEWDKLGGNASAMATPAVGVIAGNFPMVLQPILSDSIKEYGLQSANALKEVVTYEGTTPDGKPIMMENTLGDLIDKVMIAHDAYAKALDSPASGPVWKKAEADLLAALEPFAGKIEFKQGPLKGKVYDGSKLLGGLKGQSLYDAFTRTVGSRRSIEGSTAKTNIIPGDKNMPVTKIPSPPPGPKTKKNPWRPAVLAGGRFLVHNPGQTQFQVIRANVADPVAQQILQSSTYSDTYAEQLLVDHANIYDRSGDLPKAKANLANVLSQVNTAFYTPAGKELRRTYSDMLYKQWGKGGYDIVNVGSAEFNQAVEDVYAGKLTPDDFVNKVFKKYPEWQKSEMARQWVDTYSVTHTNQTKDVEGYNQIVYGTGRLFAESLDKKGPVPDKDGTYYAPLANNASAKDPFSAAGNSSFLAAPGAEITKPLFTDESELQKFRDDLEKRKLDITAVGTGDPGLNAGIWTILEGSGNGFISAVFNAVPNIGSALGGQVAGGPPALDSFRTGMTNDTDLEYDAVNNGKASAWTLIDYMLQRSAARNGRLPGAGKIKYK